MTKPTHSKIRLVFRVKDDGVPSTFIHIENQQALFILQILKAVKERAAAEKDKNKIIKLSIEDICKAVGTKNKGRVTTIARLLAGYLWIDSPGPNGKYVKIIDSTIDIQKGLYHKKRNLPKTPKFLKPPYFFVAQTT